MLRVFEQGVDYSSLALEVGLLPLGVATLGGRVRPPKGGTYLLRLLSLVGQNGRQGVAERMRLLVS